MYYYFMIILFCITVSLIYENNCLFIFLNEHVVVPFEKHQVWILSHCIIIEIILLLNLTLLSKLNILVRYLCNIFIFMNLEIIIRIIILLFSCTQAHDLRIQWYLDVLTEVCVHIRYTPFIYYIVWQFAYSIKSFFLFIFIHLKVIQLYTGHCQTFYVFYFKYL